MEELHKSQVDIIWAPSGKNSADEKLKEIMQRYADIYGKGARIVLLSSDGDFAPTIGK